MCYHVNLEICCEDEPSNAFPKTLAVLRFLVGCHAARVAHKLEEHASGCPTPLPSAEECPNYDPEYIRFERIFYTKCAECLVSKGPQKYGLNGYDMPIVQQNENLLLDQLVNAVQTRPYENVVLRLPEEFNIHERWMLSGSRWTEAHVIDQGDPLGPNPTYDLEGIRWWVEQGVDGIDPDVLEWLKGLPLSIFYPDEPRKSLSDVDNSSDSDANEEGIPRSPASVQSDSSMEGYEWYDNWAEHHAYLPAQCTLEELRALQASHRIANSGASGPTTKPYVPT
ncbi:uncharacterized protein F4812DRAFT_469869 [Daldinia caldariorum]|uniref:uncharacterized protein n=1 Tax=Daldinia caldariorum TaxID=326644 RepID=UPI002008D59A|nr:uncharacterized protein F4812DRAFT_469869 [Daldinia caldariorum]KAI1469813.1 hypothetical protein F4812DRAFT_469869 [Daldinia caldariorum]